MIFGVYEAQLVDAMVLMYSRGFDDASTRVLQMVSQRALLVPEHEPDTLPSVEIEVDNESNTDFTVLHIEAADIIGFLYELTTALTLCDVHVEQVQLSSVEKRIIGHLQVTRRDGERITDETRHTGTSRGDRVDQAVHAPAASIAGTGSVTASVSRLSQSVLYPRRLG